jgi:hypothetical protein
VVTDFIIRNRYGTIAGLHVSFWGLSRLTSSRSIGCLLQALFSKFVFFSGPFNPPGLVTDLSRVNVSTKALGYEQLGYWYAFTKEGFGKVIGDHVSGMSNSPIY